MAPKKTRKPLQKATVAETACDAESQTTSNVNKKILDRIQKCLNRAYHANASEAEAKTALFISQKLMSEHNVTQADLLANEGTENKAQHGGRSIVKIKKIGGASRRVQSEAFVGTIASAMCTFFDCKHFSTDCYTEITWTFYGIASNTVAAAIAFEMVHNLILEWAMDYKGGSSTFCYRVGVADGLWKMAVREKNAELEEAKRIEVLKRKEIEAREAHKSPEPQGPQQVKIEEQVEAADEQNRESDPVTTAPSTNGYPQHVKIEEEVETADEQENDSDPVTAAPSTNGYPQQVKIEQQVETADEQEHESDSDTAVPFTNGNSSMDSFAFEARSDSDDGEVGLDDTQIKTDFNINDIPVIDLCSDDDMDETINNYMKREPSEPLRPNTLPAYSASSDSKPVKDEPEAESSTSGWQSQMQLVQFRTTAEQVAKDYLAQEKIKLNRGRKRTSTISDQDSYHQGRKDSAKINVRQKKLCN